MVVRNESLRLPYIFKHYSQLGVNRFFVVDNGSTDQTLPFLLSQDNTHVFSISENYAKSNAGYEWIRILLNRYGKGHWCLLIDADELFIYPHYEQVSLRDLCNFLEKQGSSALGSMLLEIYANKPLRLAEYRKGEDPLVCFPYFDKDTHSVSANPFKRYSNASFYTGGMCKRVFGLNSWLNKVSLFKFKRSISFFPGGQHFIAGAKLSDIEGAVLHFKYASDFIRLTMEEAEREEHFDNAKNYKKYAKKISQDPEINLYYPGSMKFEGSKQLLELKIMKTSKEFDNKFLLKKQGKTNPSLTNTFLYFD